MASLKISITIHPTLNFKTKIKVECDGSDSTLPLENLLIEAAPAEDGNPNLRLQFTNPAVSEEKTPPEFFLPPLPVKKYWWQRILNPGWIHKSSAIIPIKRLREKVTDKPPFA